MTEIRFYHLQASSLEQALPGLLQKALSTGRRIIVRTKDAAAAEQLNAALWTYHPDSFLPHGSAKDGHAADQPIWLTHENDNPNGADMIVLTGGAPDAGIADFTLCCEMLEGHDQDAVSSARARWKTYGAAGHVVTYWQQTDKGWEKKA